MTVNRAKGEIEFVCDFCMESAVTDESKFEEIWKDLKERGWRAFKRNEWEWTHKCPTCINQGVPKRGTSR
jgi:predicted P-loop ATPase